MRKFGRWFWLIAPVAGVGLVALAASGSASASTNGGGGSAGGATWAARWAVLEPHAAALELALGWDGLTDFLMVVAWQESKGVLDISHDGGIGRGPFALHATTSSVQALGGKSALPLLSDPRVAVATAASHAYRLTRGTYSYPRDDTRWQDIDAGWAIPSWTGNRNAAPFVDGNGNVKTREAVVGRFVQRSNELGRPSLPNSKALPANWPGLRAALTFLESPYAAQVDAASPAA